MVNRFNEPMVGQWTGMIREVPKNEHPDEHARKVIFEETSYSVEQFDTKGTISFENKYNDINGMNVYLFNINQVLMKNKIAKTKNGILQWKQLDWILKENNRGVDPMVKQGLPKLIEKKGIVKFQFKDGEITRIPQTAHP